MPNEKKRSRVKKIYNKIKKESQCQKYRLFLRPKRDKCLIPLFILGVKKKRKEKNVIFAAAAVAVELNPFSLSINHLFIERIHSLPFCIPQLRTYHVYCMEYTTLCIILLFLLICFAFAVCKPPFDL